MPRVSVIIPSYNSAAFLPATLDSVLAQTYGDFEVILADDGSTDDTAAVVARYGARIRYLRQPNAGVSAARNLALGVATGAFVAYVDSDDLWAPTKLARQLEFLAAQPQAGIVHSDFALIDESGALMQPRFNGAQPRPIPQGVCLPMLLRHCHIQLCTVMERREVTEALGGFDRRFQGTEDYFRWISAGMAGVHLGYLDEPLALYRRRQGSLSGVRNHTVNLVRVFEVLLAEARLAERFGPEAERLARERLRELRRELVHRDYLAGDHAAARALLRTLIADRPGDASLYREYAKACLPPGLAGALRAWRGRAHA